MTTESSNSEVAVRLQLFSGKSEDWDVWSFGFKARSVIYKYEDIISGGVTVPTQKEYKDVVDSKDESNMSDKEKRNCIA